MNLSSRADVKWLYKKGEIQQNCHAKTIVLDVTASVYLFFTE